MRYVDNANSTDNIAALETSDRAACLDSNGFECFNNFPARLRQQTGPVLQLSIFRRSGNNQELPDVLRISRFTRCFFEINDFCMMHAFFNKTSTGNLRLSKTTRVLVVSQQAHRAPRLAQVPAALRLNWGRRLLEREQATPYEDTAMLFEPRGVPRFCFPSSN